MLSISKQYKFILAVLLWAILFSSCASRSNNALFTSKHDIVADTLQTVFVVNDRGQEDLYYKIKSSDQLSIRNLQNVDFGAQNTVPTTVSALSVFTVEPDGTAILPVIGKVQLGGLTRRQATAKLQELYEKNLLKNPIIELTIVNLKVTLLGEFKAQGNYLLERDNTSLVDIIGQAGGITEKADAKRLKIIRGDRKNPEIIYANLKDVNSLGSPKLILQNNDLVYLGSKSSSTEKLQLIMTYAQPILLLVNTYVILNNAR